MYLTLVLALAKTMSEKELIDGCIRNDRRFQELLYRRYFAKMMAMCLRYTHDREQAMDIVNNGFLRVFKKLHTFEFKGSLEGWVRRLVYHSISDYFKKNAKYIKHIVLEEKDDSQSEKAYQNLFFEDILKMVDRLPPATKDVFRLYAIEGYTHKEIAVNLGISEGTSKWHLSNARAKLRSMLEQNNDYKLHAG